MTPKLITLLHLLKQAIQEEHLLLQKALLFVLGRLQYQLPPEVVEGVHIGAHGAE
jgi:acyl carrier protein phosphodiesterase